MHGLERADVEDLAGTPVEGGVRGEDDPLHHVLAGSRYRHDQTGGRGLTLDPTLEHARQLGGGGREVGQLVEDHRTPPRDRRGFARQPIEEGAPVGIGDVAEARKSLGYGPCEVSPLHLRRRLVRDGVEPVLAAAPLGEDARLADAAPSVDDGKPPSFAPGEPGEPVDLLLAIDEAHYARQYYPGAYKESSAACRPWLVRCSRTSACTARSRKRRGRRGCERRRRGRLLPEIAQRVIGHVGSEAHPGLEEFLDDRTRRCDAALPAREQDDAERAAHRDAERPRAAAVRELVDEPYGAGRRASEREDLRLAGAEVPCLDVRGDHDRRCRVDPRGVPPDGRAADCREVWLS